MAKNKGKKKSKKEEKLETAEVRDVVADRPKPLNRSPK